MLNVQTVQLWEVQTVQCKAAQANIGSAPPLVQFRPEFWAYKSILVNTNVLGNTKVFWSTQMFKWLEKTGCESESERAAETKLKRKTQF